MMNTAAIARIAGVTMALVGAALPSGQVLAETTKERIFRDGTIVIGIHNRSPWGLRDDNTGEATGWHPDLMRAAFEELGVRKIEFKVTEFGALIPGLLAGRFDAVASGLAITPERCKQVSFGAPDLQAPDAAIVLEGNPRNIHSYEDVARNDELVMGAGRGSVVTRNAAAVGVPDSRMLLFPDIESNVSALRAGRVDVVVLSSATVIGLLAGNGGRGLERALPFDVGEVQSNVSAIAFRQEDDDLRVVYDEQLAKLKADGRLETIMEKYGFGEPEMVPPGLTTSALCSTKS